MEEKDLIEKLSSLKKTEPRNSWVLFAKRQILNQAQEEVGQRFNLAKEVGHLLSYALYLERPAYIFAVLALVVFSGVGYKLSQNSLPGDTLYSVRSAIEKATTKTDSFSTFVVAQRRLEDLRKVVEGNKVKNLSQATEEFNLSVAEVSKGFLALVENEPEKALQVSRELVQLQEGKAQVEQILGAVIGEEETSSLINLTKTLVEAELNDLQERTLTDEQGALLTQAVTFYEQEDYARALENIWMISN